MVTVGDIGEFALIEKIAAWVAADELAREPNPLLQLRLGIGDDAAVWAVPSGNLVSTIDTVVEGSHFLTGSTSWYDVGWRLMVSNLSDIAAMGAIPLCATIALGIPSNLPVQSIEELYTGMLDACRPYQTHLVGGDVVGSSTTFVTASLNGVVSETPLSRAKAKVGDALLVTGPLGGSAGGLKILLEDIPIASDAHRDLVRCHQHPSARIVEGRVLVGLGVLCAMDVSDGLMIDLQKIARSSQVGIRLEPDRIPVSIPLRTVFPNHSLQLAVTGGEDYELLFTCPIRMLDSVCKKLPSSSVIGEIIDLGAGMVTLSDPPAELSGYQSSGWEHFRR